MKIEMELVLPSIPHLIRVKMPPGHRQDGFAESPSIPIAELTDKQLEEIGAAWTLELIQRARTGRLARPLK